MLLGETLIFNIETNSTSEKKWLDETKEQLAHIIVLVHDLRLLARITITSITYLTGYSMNFLLFDLMYSLFLPEETGVFLGITVALNDIF